MKKTLTTAAMLAIIAAGATAHADQINGQHVESNDGCTIILADGTTASNDDGKWYIDGTEVAITPDPVETPHLDAPEHHETKPEGATITPRITAPTEEQTKPTISEPKPVTTEEQTKPTISESKPVTTEEQTKPTISESKPVTTEEQTKPTITPAYSSNVDKETTAPQPTESTTQATPTQAHAVTKSIDFKTPAPTYQAKGAPLPATGEANGAGITGIGTAAITIAALAIYLQRKGA